MTAGEMFVDDGMSVAVAAAVTWGICGYWVDGSSHYSIEFANV